ncbi:uncharacterized protein LOC116424216 [Nomia melanderi]|uniref:uncharacterized protein LOC116424216 n=1 Tax=Nomia melanderi TaxID=2448451 RepID=UPI003FCE944E
MKFRSCFTLVQQRVKNTVLKLAILYHCPLNRCSMLVKPLTFVYLLLYNAFCLYKHTNAHTEDSVYGNRRSRVTKKTWVTDGNGVGRVPKRMEITGIFSKVRH